MGKKHHQKNKPAPKIDLSEVLNRIQVNLVDKQPEEALKGLRRLETHLRQAEAKPGSADPALIAAKPQIHSLLAKANFASALQATDPVQKNAFLEEAIKRSPADAGYLFTAGATALVQGNPKLALDRFQRVHQLAPGNRLMERAQLTAWLVAGQTREVRDFLRRLTPEQTTPTHQRIEFLRSALTGGLEPTTTQPVKPVQTKKSKPTTDTAFSTLETPVFSGWTALLQGNEPEALTQFANLPVITHHLSKTEAAVLGSQSFYAGWMQIRAGELKSALMNLSEAHRIASASGLTLPWVTRLKPCFFALADQALQTDQLDIAMAVWELLHQLEPTNEAIKKNLAFAFQIKAGEAWKQQNLPEAIEFWKRSYGGSKDEQTLKHLAIALEQSEKIDESISYWKQYLQRQRQQLKSRGTDTAFKQSLVQLTEHVLDLMLSTDRPNHEVFQELDNGLKLDPTNLELRKIGAEIYMGLGKTQQALKHIEVIERAHGASVDILILKGFILGPEKKNFDKAFACFEQAYQLDPDNPRAQAVYGLGLNRAGINAEERGDTKSAIEFYEKALTINPSFTPSLLSLLLLYLTQKDQVKADETIARLLATEHNKAGIHLSIASALMKYGDPKQGENHIKQALKLDSSAETIYDIGEIYLNANRMKEAHKYFDRLLKQEDIEPALDVVSLFGKEGMYQEALGYCDKIAKAFPIDPEPHFAKAFFLTEQLELTKAYAELEAAERKALKYDPLDRLPEIRMQKNGIQKVLDLMKSLPPGGPKFPFSF
ncbi:MAG: tetratricopeptide repeat protein [Acidobacteria bacterium]|nr:tetratricopeptide repeat protein [Acidobacteriota bacterium]